MTLYQALGADGLKTSPNLSAYSSETKHNAICDYLAGKRTLREIQKKYRIRSNEQLRNWIMPKQQKNTGYPTNRFTNG